MYIFNKHTEKIESFIDLEKTFWYDVYGLQRKNLRVFFLVMKCI